MPIRAWRVEYLGPTTGVWGDEKLRLGLFVCFFLKMFIRERKIKALSASDLSVFALLLLVCLAAGCASPIGVVRGTTQETYHHLTANVFSTGEPSNWSKQVLQRSNLMERYDDDPEAALGEMQKTLGVRLTPGHLFALAELSFYHAEQSDSTEHYLAAAVYAYAFLFPENDARPPNPLDPRLRLAATLYNLGLVLGLDSPDGEEVLLQEGTYALPFGKLELTVEPSGFYWAGYRLKRFIPVGEFEIRGLSNRYRQAGIGAPLAGEVEPADSGPAVELLRKRIPPRIKVAVTAFVRIEEPRRGVLTGNLRGRLELYTADQESTVALGGRKVPLEQERTATLAYMLEGAPVWDFEIAGFRFADKNTILGDGLVMLHPYHKGRIPVVLVHGTASSPARWAEMINELIHDPVISGRYQVWLFQYGTGQPILYSTMLLRRALHNILKEVDPKGQDAALRRMVMIGHSQGGLLTKIMVINSGTRFWENISDEPFEDMEMKRETRDLLREGMFFEAEPNIERVIFISTPHRGSYRATGWVLKLVDMLVKSPGRVASAMHDLLKEQQFAHLKMSQLPTSVDNMSPGHPFIRTLADIPVDQRVTAHSIIPVLGDWPPMIGKTDGVVAYESAHIEEVVSEKVIRSGHSTQAHPDTIEEVRRILREHIGAQ